VAGIEMNLFLLQMDGYYIMAKVGGQAFSLFGERKVSVVFGICHD
jgi:hypothetical protein